MSLAEHKACLHCGYDLFGLDGDPIQCPECGESNALADLAVPVRRRRDRACYIWASVLGAGMVAIPLALPSYIIMLVPLSMPLVAGVLGFLEPIRPWRWALVMTASGCATAAVL